MKPKEESLENLRQLRAMEKFLEDMSIFYPGIADEADKGILTDLVNRGIDEFTTVVHRGGVAGGGQIYSLEIIYSLSVFSIFTYFH